MLGSIASDRDDVCEIGAGPGLHESLQPIRDKLGNLTGIDLSPSVLSNPWLNHSIQGDFEMAFNNGEKFNHAFAFNVVEHIENPNKFLVKLSEILHPGGTFLALTPNVRHPFCQISRIVEGLKLKHFYRNWLSRGTKEFSVNDYPAYYRLNDPYHISRLVKENKLPIDSIEAFYLPAGWNGYFPFFLKKLPDIIDFALKSIPRSELILILKIVKSKSLD